MSRLPIQLPPASTRPARSRLRGTVLTGLAFAAVFLAALLAMELMLG